MPQAVRATLLLLAFAMVFSGCRRTAPPTEARPDTFPATEISGVLTNWSGGEAFVTLTGGYSVSSTDDPDVDVVELSTPSYQGPVSPEGTFQVELSAPDPATLNPLGCTAADPEIAFLGVGVASSVPTPTRGDEVFGFYSAGAPQMPRRLGGWLYVAEAYQAEASCTAAAQTGLSRIDLTLAPGWNQVIVSFTETGTVLTSGAVPDAFVWSEYF